jgi:hypothetical protein
LWRNRDFFNATENFQGGAGKLILVGARRETSVFFGVDEVWSAKTPRPSSSTVQEAVLVVKPVQDGVHHHAAGPIEVMPLALHLHRAVPARNGKTGS